MRRKRQWGVLVGLAPAAIIAVVAYLGTLVWTVSLSFTSSRMIPVAKFDGLTQYARLLRNDRWSVAYTNMIIFGVLMVGLSLVIGFILAVALDQKVRSEAVFRTVFLYPWALSFVVTGLIWQWLLNPTIGIERLVRSFGFESFNFDWIAHRETAIYCVVLAGVWHASGLVMAIMLSGLRGIDPELRKAARIEGIRPWQYYLYIVIPLMRPTFVSAFVLLSLGVVKLYELVLVLTGGGPGYSSDVPAKFVMDYTFDRQNIGLGMAAATLLLVTVLILLVPWLYVQYFRNPARRAA